MIRYIARTAAFGVAVLLALVAIVFALQHASGLNPARALLGANASSEAVAAKEHELGYDRPIAVQFLSYVSNALHGDLGVSVTTRGPVTTDIARYLPATLELAIAAVVPGCADYNTRVREPDGFQLPHPPRDSREFPTLTGKANFAVNPMQWVPVPPGRLVLQTLRSHDQYNTTIYGLDDRYRGVKGGRRVVFVNPADIETLGLTEGDRVDLVSEFTDTDGQLQERRAKDFLVVPYSTPVGNAAAYYPETNPLVPLDHVAARSNTPVSKAIVIRLEPGSQHTEGGATWAG